MNLIHTESTLPLVSIGGDLGLFVLSLIIGVSFIVAVGYVVRTLVYR